LNVSILADTLSKFILKGSSSQQEGGVVDSSNYHRNKHIVLLVMGSKSFQ